jgi:hypothetical protein
MSGFVLRSWRQDSVASPADHRDMLSIITQWIIARDRVSISSYAPTSKPPTAGSRSPPSGNATTLALAGLGQ